MAEEKESFTLSIRDMITYGSIGVTVAMAWGAFGTRVSLLEKSISDHDKTIEEVRKKVEDYDKKLTTMDGRLRENEATVEDLFRSVRRLQSSVYGDSNGPSGSATRPPAEYQQSATNPQNPPAVLYPSTKR